MRKKLLFIYNVPVSYTHLIVLMMEPGKEYKTAEIAGWIDLKSSRTRELLKVLTENGEIEAIGNNRDRTYKRTH